MKIKISLSENFQGLQIDLLLTRNKLFAKIEQQYNQPTEFGEATIKCATVEGLLILKLYALPSLYRQGIFDRAGLYENDIFQLLLRYPIDLDPIWKTLSPYLIASDLNEMKRLLSEIQARIQRLQKWRETES